jgi:hypothetical protein
MRQTRGGAERVTITTLRFWIGSKLNPNGKYRVKEERLVLVRFDELE